MSASIAIGSRSFFGDQRARRVGDILTINISIDDSAKVANESKRSRANTEKAGMPSLFGLEAGTLNRVLPAGASAASLVDLSSNTNNDGKGSVDRNEKIDLKVAALVTQSLPNGNLVVRVQNSGPAETGHDREPGLWPGLGCPWP
mgnify:CR=1 FL=1